MGCFNPLMGYRSRIQNENGKFPIIWKEKDSDGTGAIQLPCGRCTGCRLEYSRQWALRCHHESQMHEYNAFITLTYSPEHMPENQSIDKPTIQKFFKRLRKALNDKKIRYFACGEYGEQNNRPHYHAIIFGYDFPDKTLYSVRNGHSLFRSELLEKIWPYGFAIIGNVSFESAAYVARYVMKKRKGKPDQIDKHGRTNEEYYKIVNQETGEVHDIEPEFCLMSRRPGIGKTWFDTYRGDVEKDYVTLATGGKYKLPKYYDSLLEKEDPFDFMDRKEKRKENINHEDNTFARLRVKNKVKDAQINQLERNYENET